MVTLLVCCKRRATLVSCSGVIGVAPKFLIGRRLNFLVRGSGRGVGRRALMLSKGRRRRGSRLCWRVILDGGSLAWLKN